MSYAFEWTPVPVFLGALLLLLVPGFALIAVIVVALAAVAALIALVGVMLATPYLIVRTLRRLLAERHRRKGHEPLQPSCPRRSNDSKELTVNLRRSRRRPCFR